ncbi:NAD(P)/FAD-dependent oxidoreductase [Nocardioides marmoriginsengisoli]|uniref:NAD(P)/FAD-dependent oxidoreductase n=1 Tax=Nocardioides marmoriginsengisoli TaxID=661483 RepID=A0A3N0CH23_9ACTN|nr:NAD(P)/FAD-dependent oxidoreductase [Nocardioides marmoriginsengisoli]RNL62738.1 NAD(P)/FAD-dependent oxidoreductase [Nocardioides marmoriginsengisoli]
MNATDTRAKMAALDVDALRAKYADERDRRLNPLEQAQYASVEGELGWVDADPYVDEPLVREPLDETVEVLVVGAGFGGLLAAAHLKKRGIEDLRVIDKASDFGGTWYWNRYPGAQCDVESYIYLPLLEEVGQFPTEKYAHRPEIFAHAQAIGKHFGLYEQAIFQTEITSMTWEEESLRWIVRTDRDDLIRARYVFTASGPLNRPKLPGIPGINNFQGKIFHTSRWDYEYTRGNHTGGMTGLADKRVAIVGTGATAIQAVPYLARDAAHLYVVQRTPSNVSRRGNQPTDPEWVGTLTPGWQQRRMDNFSRLSAGVPVEEDLVRDGWTEMFRDLYTAFGWAPEEGEEVTPDVMMDVIERTDYLAGEKMREWIASQVEDPETAEALKPWYGVLCKRPAFNDGYLPAFNRDNVSLVDTHGAGISEITTDSIVVDGVSHPVDCIIFATGFEVATSANRTAGADIRGVNGEQLTDHFADGPRTFHGFYVHGFPNLFLLGSGNNAVKGNFTDMLGEQAEHLAGVIVEAQAARGARIEATAEAEDAWRGTIREKTAEIRQVAANCTPGYFNSEGDVERSWAANTYGGFGGVPEFTELLGAWRDRKDLDGLTVSS